MDNYAKLFEEHNLLKKKYKGLISRIEFLENENALMRKNYFLHIKKDKEELINSLDYYYKKSNELEQIINHLKQTKIKD